VRNIQSDYSNSAESLSNLSFNEYYVVETRVQFIYIYKRHSLKEKSNNHQSGSHHAGIVNTNVIRFEDYDIKIDVSITGRHLAAFVSNTGIFGVVDLRNGGRLLYGRSFNSDVKGYLGRPEEDEQCDAPLVQLTATTNTPCGGEGICNDYYHNRYHRHCHHAFITTFVNRIVVLTFSED